MKKAFYPFLTLRDIGKKSLGNINRRDFFVGEKP